MGNLGGYQAVTSLMKTLGGPAKAAVVVLGGTFIAGGAAFAGGQKLVSAVRNTIVSRREPCTTVGGIYKASSDGQDESGIRFRAGDEYEVLECVCKEDGALIDVIGDPNSPYVVSGQFLRTHSDFPVRHGAKP